MRELKVGDKIRDKDDPKDVGIITLITDYKIWAIWNGMVGECWIPKHRVVLVEVIKK